MPTDASATPEWVTVAGGIESVLKSAAIIGAGLWTYTVFVRQRQRYPSAKLDLELSHRRLASGGYLLRAEMTLTNIGKALIRIDRSDITIVRVEPLSSRLLAEALKDHKPLDSGGRREIQWYRIGHRAIRHDAPLEVEPGEVESLGYEFVVAPVVTVVRAVGHITNCEKRRRGKWWKGEKAMQEIGWGCSSYYELR